MVQAGKTPRRHPLPRRRSTLLALTRVSSQGLDQDAIERYNHISADFNNEFLPNLLSFPNVDDATTYTTDFLTELKKDVMVQLRKIFKHSPDVKIKWVLTVPAVWDLAARQLTERCAERAGFPKPTLVLEPVGGLAHALMPYALPESLKDQGFKDGSQIVVLDGKSPAAARRAA